MNGCSQARNEQNAVHISTAFANLWKKKKTPPGKSCLMDSRAKSLRRVASQSNTERQTLFRVSTDILVC